MSLFIARRHTAAVHSAILMYQFRPSVCPRVRLSRPDVVLSELSRASRNQCRVEAYGLWIFFLPEFLTMFQ